MTTTILGGPGDDTFDVSGDVTQPIVSRDLTGRSGVIENTLTATNEAPGLLPGQSYNGIDGGGIAVSVADALAGLVVLTESAGNTIVSEGGQTDSYTVHLAKSPDANETVYLTLSAADAPSEAFAAGSRTVLISADNGLTWNTSLVLDFTSANYLLNRTILVKAIDDTAKEGTQTVMISTGVLVSDPTHDSNDFNQFAVRNVQVTVLDNDQADLYITQPVSGPVVLAGTTATRIQDSYSLSLSVAPAAGTTVTVTLGHDAILALSSADPRFNAAAQTVTFDSTNWSSPIAITITAVAGGTPKNTLISTITQTITSTDPAYQGVTAAGVDVKVISSDKAGVLMTPTDPITGKPDGSTLVDPNTTDTYTMRLTAQPQGAGVQVPVRVHTDGQELISSTDGRFAVTTTFNTQPFDASSSASVNLAADTITFASAHGFATGDQVIYQGEGGNSVGGLTSNQTYWVIAKSATAIQLASTPSNAAAGIAIDLTSLGTLLAGASQRITRPEVATVTFDATNWYMPVKITVSYNAAWTPSPGDQNFKKFPTADHLTSTIAGPLSIGGFTNGQPDRSLTTAIIQPKFPNVTLAGLAANPALAEHDAGPFAAPPFPTSDSTSFDRLNVFNDGSVSNDAGTLTGTNLSGLGITGPLTQDIGTPGHPQLLTIPGGITYQDVEVLDVLLGQGNDTLNVNSTLTPDNTTFGGITLIHGGGGNDALSVVPAAGSSSPTVTLTSPLVLYGDTSQDGSRVQRHPWPADVLRTPLPAGRRPQRRHHRRQRLLSPVAIYGGLGNDLINGGRADDELAGGGGNDTIHGNGGNDVLYGDSGFNAVFYGEPGFPATLAADAGLTPNVGKNTRDLAVPTANVSPSADPSTALPSGHAPDSDEMVAGHDVLTGDAGDDIAFGDHGIVTQTTLQPGEPIGTLRLVTPGPVKRVETTRDANGVSDVIDGGTGNDFLLGGYGGDSITDAIGENVIFGDFGYINLTPANTSSPIDSMGTLDPSLGAPSPDENDTIIAGLGDVVRSDIIFGGSGDDAITGGSGPNNIVFGDSGEILSAATVNGTPNLAQPLDGHLITLGQVGTTDPLFGGNDRITTGLGRDMIFGGPGSDQIVANNGETAATPDGSDIVFGDQGYLDYVSSDRDQTDIDVIAAGDLVPFAPGINGGNDIATGAVDLGTGGGDVVTTGSGGDIIVGGVGGDAIVAGAGNNLVFGDDGQALSAVTVNGTPDLQAQGLDGYPITLGQVGTIAPLIGGNDSITTGVGRDIIFGGLGSDQIVANSGETAANPDAEDDVFGDQAYIDYVSYDRDPTDMDVISSGSLLPFGNGITGGNDTSLTTTDLGAGGDDVIVTGMGSDIVVGGVGNDAITVGVGNNLVFGDNGLILSAVTVNSSSDLQAQAAQRASDHARPGRDDLAPDRGQRLDHRPASAATSSSAAPPTTRSPPMSARRHPRPTATTSSSAIRATSITSRPIATRATSTSSPRATCCPWAARSPAQTTLPSRRTPSTSTPAATTSSPRASATTSSSAGRAPTRSIRATARASSSATVAGSPRCDSTRPSATTRPRRSAPTPSRSAT